METDGKTIELTWSRCIVVWWSLLWRTVLLGVVGGVMIAVIAEWMGRMLGAPHGQTGAIAFFATYHIFGIFALKLLFNKKYHKFRVGLVSRR